MGTETLDTSALADLPRGLPFVGVELPACADPAASSDFERAGNIHAATRATRRAVATCQRCPYLEPCAEWALEHGERWSVWGGMTRRQRRAEIRRRNQAAKNL